MLVLGAGAVGLLTCSLARASGCTQVVAVDIEQAKLDFGAQMGWTTGTYALPKGPRVSALEAVEASKVGWEGIKSSSAVASVEGLGDGFDCVFECTGVEVCMQIAVQVRYLFFSRLSDTYPISGCERVRTDGQAALPGSKVLFVGMGTPNLTLPTGPSLLREVDLLGVFRYANCYPDAIALLGSGRLGDVSKMFTQTYPLERASEAFEAMRAGRDKEGNPVIKPCISSGAQDTVKK